MIEEARVMIFPITMSCNSRCKSCGIWKLRPLDKIRASPVLLQKVVSDEYLCTHIESINISGGEPYSHPDLDVFLLSILDRYTRLRELCFNTDGHLLERIVASMQTTLPACRKLKRKYRIYISLDGLNEAHDLHRRHPGAFALAEKALIALAELQGSWSDALVVNASFTITSSNYAEIDRVFEYCKGLGIRVDFNLAARPEVFIGGAGLDRDFGIRPEQIAAITASIRKICREPTFLNFTPPFYETMLDTLTSGRRTRGCFFPKQGFVIMPSGKLYICGTRLDYLFGDLSEHSFEECWHGSLRRQCCAEKIPAMCESCFANSYESWDLVSGATV